MSGSKARLQAIEAVKDYTPPAGIPESGAPGDVFGENVFSKSVMQKRLHKLVFKSMMATIERDDGVAENFHTAQNRRLLEQLSSETGGSYWKPSDLKNLPRDISYSEAGISVRSPKELWDMPIVFLLLLGLPLTEWLLRRKWGVV